MSEDGIKTQNGKILGPDGKPLNIPRWLLYVIGVVTAGIGVLLLLVFAGLAVVVVPIIMMLYYIARWYQRRGERKARASGEDYMPPGANTFSQSPVTNNESVPPKKIDIQIRVIDSDYKEIDPPAKPTSLH